MGATVARDRSSRPSLATVARDYEYLDGRTTDRAARVERFQTDEACPVFLISLQAGGFGLNLTAADYEVSLSTCRLSSSQLAAD